METLQRLGKRIESTRDLQSVVTTMKSLAAVSIRQYNRAADSLEHYQDTIRRGLQALLMRRPPFSSRIDEKDEADADVILVIGSDQGMCGQLNEDAVAFLRNRSEPSGSNGRQGWLVAIGERVAGALRAEGRDPEVTFRVPGSVSGLAPLVQDILLAIEDRRAGRGLSRLSIVYNHRLSGSSYEARSIQPLPLDREWLESISREEWPTNQLPTYTMAWENLFSALVREFLFGSINLALIQSLASENAARLAAMQAAEKNIDERLDELQAKYHRQRQSTITSELHDIVSGFTALTRSS